MPPQLCQVGPPTALFWLFCMYSETLRAICWNNPTEALFSIVTVCVCESVCVCVCVCLRAQFVWGLRRLKVTPDEPNVWMRPRCSWQVFESCPEGFVFMCVESKTIIATNCSPCFHSFKKSCCLFFSSSFFLSLPCSIFRIQKSFKGSHWIKCAKSALVSSSFPPFILLPVHRCRRHLPARDSYDWWAW